MRTLVTGGAGFIGSHLVRRLLREGDGPVVVLDNLHRGSLAALGDDAARVEFIEGDIRDAAAVRKATRGVDSIFHLAAQSSVMNAQADEGYTLSTNVEGTRNVLDAAAHERVRRVMFTSSREVYGDPRVVPVPETAELAPKNTYGRSKVLGEQLCGEFAGQVDSAILRLANVYGPGDRDRVLPIFLKNAIADRPLKLFGGQQVIDFVWIDVVVDVLLQVARSGRNVAAEPVNIGSGRGTTVEQLARRVIATTGSRSRIEMEPIREAEVACFVADITNAGELLGLRSPSDPLEQLFGMIELLGTPLVRSAS